MSTGASVVEMVARYVERRLSDHIRVYGSVSRDVVQRIKLEAAKKFGLGYTPSNADLIPYISSESVRSLLLKKPVRSISGIVIVAIMTAPFECPHGRCIYCPHYPDAPISYTGKEPSAMRGINFQFDPYRQVESRVRQLESMGHSTDKIDIVIQGGTFNKAPEWYREAYMKRLFQFFIGYYPRSMDEAIVAAERSRYRIVGLAFETKPDAAKEEDIDWMLEHGATRVELGVQSIYDNVHRFVNRGHTQWDVVEATQLLKDAGLKVTYHLMPGLPLTSFADDIQVFERVFTSDLYLPDHLKIYPTLVLEHTGLIKLWREGRYKPLETEEARNLIATVKMNYIPPWTRVMRVNRDIPSTEVVAGVRYPNLRQLVHEELSLREARCRCIRCREAGHRYVKEGVNPDRYVIRVRRYSASQGLEFFISMEDVEKDIIIGFIRLRRPSHRAWREEIVSSESFIVRELHVYGRSLPLGSPSGESSWQHSGVGSRLLSVAEDYASTLGGEKILVISGVGVREYYYRHGYRRDGSYVSKYLG